MGAADMTLPTNEEKLAYLRKPGSPTAVDAWCVDRGKILQFDPNDVLRITGSMRDATPLAIENEQESRRALREREFCKWFAGLVWRQKMFNPYGQAVIGSQPGPTWFSNFEKTRIYAHRLHSCEYGITDPWVCRIERVNEEIKNVAWFATPADACGKRQAARAAFDVLFPDGGE